MKKVRIVLLIFIIFGLIFGVGGAVFCVKVFDYSDTVETTAVITDFESYQEYSNGKWHTHYKTHLEYSVDGKAYTNIAKMFSSGWSIGDEIEIYYDVKDPMRIGTKQTDLALLVIPCLGLVFFVLGTALMLTSYKNGGIFKGIYKSTKKSV